MEGGDFSPSPPGAKTAPFTCQNRFPTQRKMKKTRRFSDDQIRSLESMFKLETKLEQGKKLQLAREVGLQPRQVAIWFQNRRARWKSKQMEQEYRVLKGNYDNLNSRFESLREEKQSLLTQLEKLSDLLKETDAAGKVSKALEGISTNRGSDNEDTNREQKANPSTLIKGLDQDLIMHSDDDERGNTGYPAQDEEPELMNLCEQLDGSLAPTEKWCNFNSGGISDHSCGTSNWWEFWT